MPDLTRPGTRPTLSARFGMLLSWALWLAAFGCCAGGLVVTLFLTRPLTTAVLVEGAAFALAYPLGYSTVGLVLTLRRPGNPIGWLYAGSGLVWSLLLPMEPWVTRLLLDQRPLPLLAQLAVVAGELIWAPAILLGITLPALLVPDGRLRSPRWRVVAVAAVVGASVGMLAASLIPGQATETVVPVENPFALSGTPATVATVVGTVCLLLHTLSLVAALLCVVLRFRASRGVERQQLRWIVAGAAVAVVGLSLPFAWALPFWVTDLAVLCPPTAVAVAVLRYRLWDLDRLISRTVTYALVTGLLVVPYLLVVPATSRLAAGSGSLAVAAATLAAAALFQPLRRRVQDLVNSRFNRRRYDAGRTVDGFARRLRDQVDLDALHTELLAVVDQTMQPTRSSLWLRPPARQEPLGG